MFDEQTSVLAAQMAASFDSLALGARVVPQARDIQRGGFYGRYPGWSLSPADRDSLDPGLHILRPDGGCSEIKIDKLQKLGVF